MTIIVKQFIPPGDPLLLVGQSEKFVQHIVIDYLFLLFFCQ